MPLENVLTLSADTLGMLSVLAVIALVLAVLYMAWALSAAGAFRKVVVQDVAAGPYLVLYKNHVGPYSGASRAMGELRKTLVSLGLVHVSQRKCVDALGVYYDDPKTTPSKDCRFSLGYIFKQGTEVQQAADVEKHRRFLQGITAVKRGELKVGYFPPSKALAVRWPFHSYLCVMLAVLRGYPALSKALRDRAQHIPVDQVKGSLEVYLPREKAMLVSFPYTPRSELLPFDSKKDL